MSLDFAKISVTLLIFFFCYLCNEVHVKTDLKVEQVPLRRIKTNKQRTALQNAPQYCGKISCTHMLSTNKVVIYQTRTTVFYCIPNSDVQYNRAFLMNFILLKPRSRK